MMGEQVMGAVLERGNEMLVMELMVRTLSIVSGGSGRD
jgi:hypothetical protein